MGKRLIEKTKTAQKSTEYRYFLNLFFGKYWLCIRADSFIEAHPLSSGKGFVVPCHYREAARTQASLLFTSHVILGKDCSGIKKKAHGVEIEGSVELSEILSLST